jgi:hypothetical protein
MAIKTLHRIYFGFDGKEDPFIGYLKTWKEQLPEYTIKYWNSSNLPVDINNYTKKMFELKDYAFLSDYFRWWILREEGGIYFDADIEIVNGRGFDLLVDDLLKAQDYDAFIGIDDKSGGWYTAHSMPAKTGASMPRFMCRIYENMGDLVLWRRNIFYFMAPQLSALYFYANGHNTAGMGTTPNLNDPKIFSRVLIYPQEYFSPILPKVSEGNKGTFVVDAFTEKTCICHHFACTWHEDNSPYKNKTRNFNLLLKDIEADKTSVYNKGKNYNKVIRLLIKLYKYVIAAPRKLINAIRNA